MPNPANTPDRTPDGPTARTLRPWWREPIILGIAGLVVLASMGIWFGDRAFPGQSPAVDPANKAALSPGAGGGFCDLPAPVKSTPYNPSTQPAR